MATSRCTWAKRTKEERGGRGGGGGEGRGRERWEGEGEVVVGGLQGDEGNVGRTKL